MNKLIILMSLCGFTVVSNAQAVPENLGNQVIASYEMSGVELWHGYFLPDHVLLIEQSDAYDSGYELINHPPYTEQNHPVHRLVCDRGRPDENGNQNRCKDEFPHVHINDSRAHYHFTDFIVASSFAKSECDSLELDAKPQFIHPQSFVDILNNPISSHQESYNLSEGLVFNCVFSANE